MIISQFCWNQFWRSNGALHSLCSCIYSQPSVSCKVQETKFKIRLSGPDDISSAVKITKRKHPSTVALEEKGLREIDQFFSAGDRTQASIYERPKTDWQGPQLEQEMENVGSQVGGGASSSAQGSYFTPLLISMAGILCTTLLIMAYHFIVVRLCIRRRQRQILRQLQLGLSTNATTSNGVDEKVLNSIPILSYSTKNGDLFCADQSECVICLGELQDGDLVKLMPSCKHVFHNLCIDKWFLRHTNCPICRSLISAPTEPVGSSPVQNHEVREDEQQTDTNFSELPQDQEMGVPNENIVTSTTSSTQLPKPNGLLRHCVSLVVLPIEGNNNVMEQSLLKGLERSLSLDECHVVINIKGENDEKPSSSSSSSCSSKPVLTHCGSLKARSIRKLDRMSSALSRSLSQFGIAQSSSTANGNGILP